ncbi:C-signal protein [Cladophialophora carrionii]|uniref:C-signal protein n=1 Tax=Cladophialophora carrionii TaxID=86049 RepID=A0A1C1CX45_9EURO|nr:C-signal protein [Cladophialophora carrionii]
MPVYVVTGANRGLGLEFVRQISQDSSNTVIAAVRSLQGELDDLKHLAARAAGKKVHILECDTGDMDSIHAFGDAIKGPLSAGQQIDYLLNNAGINATAQQTSLDMTPESLRQHIDVNVMGPAETVKVLLPSLGKGSVVLNMTSGLGSCGKKLYG